MLISRENLKREIIDNFGLKEYLLLYKAKVARTRASGWSGKRPRPANAWWPSTWDGPARTSLSTYGGRKTVPGGSPRCWAPWAAERCDILPLDSRPPWQYIMLQPAIHSLIFNKNRGFRTGKGHIDAVT